MDHKRIAIKLEAKIIPPFLSKLEKELSVLLKKLNRIKRGGVWKKSRQLTAKK